MARRQGNDSGKKWLAIFIGAIMLMSVAGFVLTLNPAGQAASFRHGGVMVTQTSEGFYRADLGEKNVFFLYAPQDLADIEVAPDIVLKLAGSRAVQVAYDWNSSLAAQMAELQLDAATILELKYGSFVEAAKPGTGCAEATGFVPVLMLAEANQTSVGIDSGNADCVVLKSENSSVAFARAADSLKYALLAGGKQ